MWSPAGTVRSCQQPWEGHEERRRERKGSWVTAGAEEGQGASQEETTRDAGGVGMRRGWWGDDSRDVGGGSAEIKSVCDPSGS